MPGGKPGKATRGKDGRLKTENNSVCSCSMRYRTVGYSHRIGGALFPMPNVGRSLDHVGSTLWDGADSINEYH